MHSPECPLAVVHHTFMPAGCNERRHHQERGARNAALTAGHRTARNPRVQDQEPAARAASSDRTAGNRATGDLRRYGGIDPRRHLVVGLRDRGNARRTGAVCRAGGVYPGDPGHAHPVAGAVLRDPFLPPSRNGLYARRRVLRRRTRELRADRGPGRRSGVAHRLHGNGRRPDGGRHRCSRIGVPGPAFLHRPDQRGRRRPYRLRQPAGDTRSRSSLCHPDVLFHLLPGDSDHHRAHPRTNRQPPSVLGSPGGPLPVRSSGQRLADGRHDLCPDALVR